jgi:hypothetical protein
LHCARTSRAFLGASLPYGQPMGGNAQSKSTYTLKAVQLLTSVRVVRSPVNAHNGADTSVLLPEPEECVS